jgi:cell fate (sporulation/competence/biofilm development) regulator YlbF (YheA/YmcA/DUF963 family)
MSENPDGMSARDELMSAAARLRQQIQMLEQSSRFPVATQSLRTALAEIELCIANLRNEED